MKSVDTCFYISLCLALLQRVLSKPAAEKLALWIDGKEIEPFIGKFGQPMDIYVIRDGEVLTYLREAYRESQLPILPPEVLSVKLTWAAPDDEYYYKFELRSLDPHILYDPLLSIPISSRIPKDESVFQMTIPCTRKLTAIASMYIVLYLHNSRGHAVPGSPIKLHLRKRCIAYESKKVCRHSCKNGGRCNDYGRCDCKPGYYGSQCHLAVCFPACMNNGNCTKPDVCVCPPGFHGKRCDFAICKRPCNHGGTCILPEKCECPADYYGDHCEYRTGQCEIPCKNGGTCTKHNVCDCVTGYRGKFCQKPICKKSCGLHGRCVDVNVCECFRGWRGKYCHKTVSTKPRRRKRRKDRMNKHGRWRRRLRRNLRKKATHCKSSC